MGAGSFLSPRARPLERALHLTPLASLEDARVGFFWNSKPNADVLLDQLERGLAGRLPLRDARRFAKPLPTSAAPAEVIEEIVRQCDVVVFASAD
jgi:hypothetical protein